MSTETIKKISKKQYVGKVYNLEVEPNDSVEDDQYYVCADTGIVVHNCHPRDNIALRWMAQELNLGYDLFDAVMLSREVQAKNMASMLLRYAAGGDLATETFSKPMPVVIVGKAYKPLVPYEAGSASMLVGHYVTEMGGELYYYDQTIGEFPPEEVMSNPCVILMAHDPKVTYGDQLDFVNEWYSQHRITGADEALTKEERNEFLTFEPAVGSVVVDPWRKMPAIDGIRVVHYGNTRREALR